MTIVDTARIVNVEERMRRIKSTGYWRVNIHPVKFETSRISSLSSCWELAESCRVMLRGWDYPAVSEKERIFGDDWVQSGADFRGMVELWRFYQSGQFIHYFSCQEDHNMAEVAHRISRNASRGLNVVSTLYRVTEIFEFAARLAQKEVVQPCLQISIKLLGMKNRELFFWEPSRRLWAEYICQIEEIEFEKELSAAEIMASAHETALDATIYILERFGWLYPTRPVLTNDQQRLLERRL